MLTLTPIIPVSPTAWRIFLGDLWHIDSQPIGSMYGIYTNIGGILMVNVTIYSSIHGSYGQWNIQKKERSRMAAAGPW